MDCFLKHLKEYLKECLQGIYDVNGSNEALLSEYNDLKPLTNIPQPYHQAKRACELENPAA